LVDSRVDARVVLKDAKSVAKRNERKDEMTVALKVDL
jgi:hypothetical protein